MEHTHDHGTGRSLLVLDQRPSHRLGPGHGAGRRLAANGWLHDLGQSGCRPELAGSESGSQDAAVGSDEYRPYRRGSRWYLTGTGGSKFREMRIEGETHPTRSYFPSFGLKRSLSGRQLPFSIQDRWTLDRLGGAATDEPATPRLTE